MIASAQGRAGACETHRMSLLPRWVPFSAFALRATADKSQPTLQRLLRLPRKDKPAHATQQPAGQITKILSSRPAKNIPLNVSGKSVL